MTEPYRPIQPDEPFCFDCHAQVPCFNACCHDLNQFLMPYDILRLKQNLQMSSQAFLSKHTYEHIGPESGLPVVTLRQRADRDRACPFVTADGCRVYIDRPASCRTYPLARLVRRDRGTGIITEDYVLIQEPHCQGFKQACARTANDWVKHQKLNSYNRMNDYMLEIISLKNQLKPGPLTPEKQQLFYTALYDLDTFREQVFKLHLLDGHRLPANLREPAMESDDGLLKLGFWWVKKSLFGK